MKIPQFGFMEREHLRQYAGEEQGSDVSGRWRRAGRGSLES